MGVKQNLQLNKLLQSEHYVSISQVRIHNIVRISEIVPNCLFLTTSYSL